MLIDRLCLPLTSTHQIATRAEQAAVRADKIPWREYDRFMGEYVKYAAHGRLTTRCRRISIRSRTATNTIAICCLRMRGAIARPRAQIARGVAIGSDFKPIQKRQRAMPTAPGHGCRARPDAGHGYGGMDDARSRRGSRRADLTIASTATTATLVYAGGDGVVFMGESVRTSAAPPRGASSAASALAKREHLRDVVATSAFSLCAARGHWCCGNGFRKSIGGSLQQCERRSTMVAEVSKR